VIIKLKQVAIVSDNQAETSCLIITINDTCTCDLTLIITISDTSKNQPKSLNYYNQIDLSSLKVTLAGTLVCLQDQHVLNSFVHVIRHSPICYHTDA
jgi:hypothetical protein